MAWNTQRNWSFGKYNNRFEYFMSILQLFSPRHCCNAVMAMVWPSPFSSPFFLSVSSPFSFVRHMDFGFTSCCFRGSTAMMLGYQVSNSENAYDFFLGYFFLQSDRPTDPISGNAFDGKRPKRGMARRT